MRYIKLYESLNYEEILFVDYNKLLEETKYLNEKESSYIQDHCNIKDCTCTIHKDIKSSKKYFDFKDKSFDDNQLYYYNVEVTVYNKSAIKIITFYKISDDYFLIKIFDYINDIYQYYKCDQFYGLKKFINYINKNLI